MLTGKYFGDGAASMPQGDLRHERFNRPETLDGLQKLPQLSFLATPTRTMVQAACTHRAATGVPKRRWSAPVGRGVWPWAAIA